MSQSAQRAKPFVVGLALFSMFFGSGNLVFPLVVGTAAQTESTWASFGFLLTGVALPFLGIFAMLRFDGQVRNFFRCVLGKRWGFFACLILLAIWIPLGSAPRCITVSFAAIKQLLPGLPLWLFSLGACAAIYPVCLNRSRMLDLLGYVLTPVLLFCLALILFMGLAASPGPQSAVELGSNQLWMGMKEGYNTMDLIASIFFSAVIIAKFKGEGRDHRTLAWKSSVIGAGLLALVYLGFISVAASQATYLQGLPREELIIHLAMRFLGQQFAIIPIIAVALSCITTAIALVFIFSEFLSQEALPQHLSVPQATALTLLMTYGLSILGFEGISKVVAPMLQVAYPFLIAVMLLNFIALRSSSRAPEEKRAPLP